MARWYWFVSSCVMLITGIVVAVLVVVFLSLCVIASLRRHHTVQQSLEQQAAQEQVHPEATYSQSGYVFTNPAYPQGAVYPANTYPPTMQTYPRGMYQQAAMEPVDDTEEFLPRYEPPEVPPPAFDTKTDIKAETPEPPAVASEQAGMPPGSSHGAESASPVRNTNPFTHQSHP